MTEAHPPAPFVVGVGRSGTTLLRLMLDAHPQLTIPPETHFLPQLIRAAGKRRTTADGLAEIVVSQRQWGDFGLDAMELRARFAALERVAPAPALRAFYGLYGERVGKPRWGDKTPIYVEHMREIAKALPEARFVHLIRDGRDVALSRIRRALDEPPPVERIAKNWSRRIRNAREQARRLPHYLELRYEDLVTDAEPALRRVGDFIDLPYDPAMLDYHHNAAERLGEMAGDLPARGGKAHRPGSERLAAHALASEPPREERIAAWREQMGAEDVAAFEAEAGDLLDELGYERAGS
jgi:Sulfotransferase family